VTLLAVEDLRVDIAGVNAVGGVSFTVADGQRVGLIGESGSGKTLTALAVMGLLPDAARASGRVVYRGDDLLTMDEDALCRLRGDRIAMVFQEPMSALDPVVRVGDQVAEPRLIHRGESRDVAMRHAVALLGRLRLSDPVSIARAYPHQLSGGQRQRVLIASALACGPDLLLADEPTSALDVTVQAQVLDLLRGAVEATHAALLLITHDLAVVAATCQQVLVMYGGRIVERGPTRDVLARPRHPYTRGLVDAHPNVVGPRLARLPAIAGSVPPLGGFPDGCVFRDRCPRAIEQCVVEPVLTGRPRRRGETPTRAVACWNPVPDR